MLIQFSWAGDFIVVGDFMRSLTLLQYNRDQKTLQVISLDFKTSRLTACEIIDDRTLFAADNELNLMVYQPDRYFDL